MVFKPKIQWQMFFIGVLFHFIVGMAFIRGIYLLPIIMALIDIFIIFPDFFIISYVFERQHLVVKRILYPNIEIYFSDIVEINPATVMRFKGMTMDRGFTKSFGIIELKHIKKKKYRTVIISIDVKERKKFLSELMLHLNNHALHSCRKDGIIE